MQKNVQQMMKRISQLKQLDRNSFTGTHNHQQILLLNEITKLKRFKYQNLSSSELRNQIQSARILTERIQDVLKSKLLHRGATQEIQLITTTLQLHTNVVDTLIDYLNREEDRSVKLNFVEEKKNRLCPVCETSIEENRLNIVRKYIDQTWLSGLTLQAEALEDQQSDIDQEDIHSNMEESEYKKTVDKILSSKKAYSYKASHTTTVLEETFKINLEKRTELGHTSFTDKDIKSAKEAMDYALEMLNSEFKGELIQHLQPILMRLIVKFQFAQNQKHEREFGDKSIQTEEFNAVKQLKIMEDKAQLLHRNLYYKQNEAEELKKVLKKLEINGQTSIEENEGEIKKLRNQNIQFGQVNKELVLEVKKLEEQVAKLQKHLRSMQVVEQRRSSKRYSIRLSKLIQMQEIQDLNRLEEDKRNGEGQVSDKGEESEGSEGRQNGQSEDEADQSSEGDESMSDEDSSQVVNDQKEGADPQQVKRKKKKKGSKKKRSHKIKVVNKEKLESQNKNQIREVGAEGNLELQKDTEREKQLLNEKIRRNMSGINLKHYNKNLSPRKKIDQTGEQQGLGLGPKIKTFQGNRSTMVRPRVKEDDVQTQARNSKAKISQGSKKRLTHKLEATANEIQGQYQEEAHHEQVGVQDRRERLLGRNNSIRKSNSNSIETNTNTNIQRKPSQKRRSKQPKQSRQQQQQQLIGGWQDQNLNESGFNSFKPTAIKSHTQHKKYSMNSQAVDAVALPEQKNDNDHSQLESEDTPEQRTVHRNDSALSYSSNQNSQSYIPPLHNNHTLNQTLNTPTITNTKSVTYKHQKHSRFPSSTDNSNPPGYHPQTPNTQTVNSSPLTSKRESNIFKLFNSKDLNQLFGSVEQAYHFQSQKQNKSAPINPTHKELMSSVYVYVNQLRKSQPSLYNWVKNFLKFPYQTAINNNSSSDLVNSLSESTFELSFGRILSLHIKCKSVKSREYCQHVKAFLVKIKYNEDLKEKSPIILPQIQKK